MSQPAGQSQKHFTSSIQESTRSIPTSIPEIREIDISDEVQDEEDTHIYPEGGIKAYLTVFGSFMGLVPAFGFINSIGAIQTYISAHQLSGVSSSSISWIFSLFTFFFFASGIFSGAWFDRVGARKPLILGTLCMCAGLMFTANCHTITQFVLAFGVLTGFGNGLLISPLVGVVAHYFKQNRATWTSVATTGGSVGGVIIPLILKKLYAQVGFEWAIRILSFFFAGCLGCAILFARECLVKKSETDDALPSGVKGMVKVYIMDSFDYRYLLELKFISCAFGVTFSEAALVVFSIYFPSYAIERGFPESTAYVLITVMNTTGILGRYIPGYLADKWVGRFNIVILTLAGCVLSSLVILLPFGYKLSMLYLYASLYGFFSGSILSLSPVCCGQISKTEDFGKRYSTMYVITSLTILAAVPIGGAIVGEGEIRNYNNFIVFASVMLIVGIACYFISRTAVVGLRWCKF